MRSRTNFRTGGGSKLESFITRRTHGCSPRSIASANAPQNLYRRANFGLQSLRSHASFCTEHRKNTGAPRMNHVLEEILRTGVATSEDGVTHRIHSHVPPDEGLFLQQVVAE